MAALYFFLWFISNCVVFLCKAQAQDQLYECYAYGDPHVVTWHPKTGIYQYYHRCYENGFFTLVKNEFVNFKVQVTSLFSIEVDLYFYNGVTPVPICLIIGNNFDFYPDDEAKCAQKGIRWDIVKNSSQQIFTISYPIANFSATMRRMLQSFYNKHHYNIHVWQTKSLVDRSTGICRQNDPACLKKPTKSNSELQSTFIPQQTRSISQSQAQSICASHLNAFLSKSRRSPYQRSANTNSTINIVMEACVQDLLLTGIAEMAGSSVDVLMVEELIADVTSVNDIKETIKTGVSNALVAFNQAVAEAQVETPQILGFETTTTKVTSTTMTSSTIRMTTETPRATTTKPIPLATFKCAIYQDLYIQTWHPTDQASPPTRSCLGASGTYDLVRNKYVRYTLRTTGSTIDELTLVLFDAISLNAICTVTMVNENAGWMDCENHGIQPTLIKTATHETLTVYYARANFTTIITRDIGINVGRFNINVYQEPELALQSAGICNVVSSCNGAGRIK